MQPPSRETYSSTIHVSTPSGTTVLNGEPNMHSNLPIPNFERADSVLTDEFFAELERNHKVMFPEHCRNIIRNSMAYEIGERVKTHADQENHEKLLEPLMRLLDELEAQRDPKTGAFEHFDIRLTRFVKPRRRDTARIEMFIAGLRDIQQAFAQKNSNATEKREKEAVAS